MKKLRIVTTSWDDGHPSDLRVAELLRSRGLSGTFYIPLVGRHEGPILAPYQLRLLLSQGFEIGAHGVTHCTLPRVGSEDLAREVSKTRLEDIIGETVQMFCYPKGRYSENVVKEVKRSGYKGARTTRWLGHGLNFDPFKMPTSLHAYPHRALDYIRNVTRGENVAGLFDYLTDFHRCSSWVDLAKRLFDCVLKDGGVWHLYGHSWAIDELNLWADLTEILDYVAGKDVIYASNSALVDLSISPTNGKGETHTGVVHT